jgi:hypothetical protein
VLKSCSKDKIKDAKNFNPTEVYNSMRDKKWQAAAPGSHWNKKKEKY